MLTSSSAIRQPRACTRSVPTGVPAADRPRRNVPGTAGILPGIIGIETDQGLIPPAVSFDPERGCL
jgi:hypothetical protein